MAVRGRVRGSKETAAALRAVGQVVGAPVNSALRAGLAPTLSAAKANVASQPFEDSTGALLSSLVIRKKRRTGKERPAYQVGPSTETERGDRRPVKYAHILEFGTERSRAFPFLGPAYEATKSLAVQIFGKKLGPALERRVHTLGAKARAAGRMK